jgi:glycosyltransferase involved in cell wall biosynthesis
VYNGFDVPEFLLASPPLRHKQIAFAGRMTEEKGALLLAEALHRVLPRFPEWRAVLIGGRRHSPSVTLSAYEQRILSTLEPLGEQVEFAGFLPHAETLRHFHASEMVVVPSLWHESFGRTALEAMACGAAVISSGSGGLPEVTGDAALTLPAVTSAALAEALTRLMEDETLRHNYQQRGRERAERFRMAHCAARLDEARERAFSLWQRGNPA